MINTLDLTASIGKLFWCFEQRGGTVCLVSWKSHSFWFLRRGVESQDVTVESQGLKQQRPSELGNWQNPGKGDNGLGKSRRKGSSETLLDAS